MKIFISTGEVSGEKYASSLVSELQKLLPDAEFKGVGGTYLTEAGVTCITDLSPISTIGFIEPVKFLFKYLSALTIIKNCISTWKPDCVIVVDYQGFHLKLLESIKHSNAKKIYFISPQEWQWGTEKGGKKVLRHLDYIIAIFKQESDFYSKLGGSVYFSGHPILDLVKATPSKDEFYQLNNLAAESKILAIYPGSRDQEITLIAPLYLKAAAICCKQNKDFVPIVALAAPFLKTKLQRLIKTHCPQAKLYEGPSKHLTQHAYFSFLKSGTVTLEHAIAETPCLAGYKLGRFSYLAATLIAGKKYREIGHFSLPNILLNERVIPELFQEKLTVDSIVNTALPFLKDSPKRKNQLEKFKQLKAQLGNPGAIQRAAAFIYEKAVNK